MFSDKKNNMAKKDNKNTIRKVKVELEIDIVNTLIKRKSFGDTYSDVIRKLLK